MKNKTNISIIGVRGIDVIYSGFETLTRNIIKESTKTNYFFNIYGRIGYQKQTPKTKLYKSIIIPTIKNKHLETPIYAIFSTIHSLFNKNQVLLYLGVANTIVLPLAKIFRKKIIVNVNGIDWNRDRWSILGKTYLKICESIAVSCADILIADSSKVLKYYQNKYSPNNMVFVPYGAEVTIRKPGITLEKFKLKKDDYFLIIGRFVPENKFHEVIKVFNSISSSKKLVIVGDQIHERDYKKKLIDLSKDNPNIIFTGILKGEDYEEVCSNAFSYIEPKSVGGIHPSLLEAMAFGNYIIARNLPEHRDALGNTGKYYSHTYPETSLKKEMQYILDNPKTKKLYQKRAVKRVGDLFSWKSINRQYNNMFKTLST